MYRNGTFVAVLMTTTLLAGGIAVAKEHQSDRPAASAPPEPYAAPDPQYTPMKSEPLLSQQKAQPVSLTDGQSSQGSSVAPEPYSAPDPQYKEMKNEPVYHPTKSAAPSLNPHG